MVERLEHIGNKGTGFGAGPLLLRLVKVLFDKLILSRAPENLKLAGNWFKVAAMSGRQNYKKKSYISSFPTNYLYYCGFYASFLGF